MTVRNCDRPMDEIVKEEGVEGLQNLPGIGEGLSRAIHQLVTSGRLPMLERLRGESDPVKALASVPGVGTRLAERLYADLGISTLEELEAAAHDGGLAEIGGFGEKRIAGVRDSLAGRFGRVRNPASAPPSEEPAVSEILDVDREYRMRTGKAMTTILTYALSTISKNRYRAKYRHNFWRPVTAIRNGANGGHPQTAGDPNWNSYLETPSHPEYPSLHAIRCAAWAEVLARFFGTDQLNLTITSAKPYPGIKRSFTSFSQAAQESSDSRVYAGVHFRGSCKEGAVMGRKIGAHRFENFLRPAGDSPPRFSRIEDLLSQPYICSATGNPPIGF